LAITDGEVQRLPSIRENKKRLVSFLFSTQESHTPPAGSVMRCGTADKESAGVEYCSMAIATGAFSALREHEAKAINKRKE